MPTVYFVIPCYNEEQVLPETVKRLTKKLEELQATNRADKDSRIFW